MNVGNVLREAGYTTGFVGKYHLTSNLDFPEFYKGKDKWINSLLARRLVDSGVRFVEVTPEGWDHHKALADEMGDVAPVFDQAFATLITDLNGYR